MNGARLVIVWLHVLVVFFAHSTPTVAAENSRRLGTPKLLVAFTPDGVAMVEVKLSETALCGSLESREPLVDGVTIRVGDRSVFVPRSAYADLVAPSQVVVEFRGSAGSVSIRGGDGAEAYVARLFFDHERVTRRTLAGSILADSPTEETRYLLRVLKDE